MSWVECPRCHNVVPAAAPGSAFTCPQCGYAPQTWTAGAPPPPAAPTQTKPTAEGKPVLAQWAFLMGLVSIGLFFVPTTGLPFLLGLLAIVLGARARREAPQDRRGLLSIVLGATGIVVAVLYVLAPFA